jgi:hypothetical protein
MKSIDCYWIVFHPLSSGDNGYEYLPVEMNFSCNPNTTDYACSIKVYHRDITMEEEAWFTKYLINTRKGGILSKNVIWYYK